MERPVVIPLVTERGPVGDWREVCGAAGEGGKRLGEAGLASFVKTSGGKGLHVVAPLKPRAGWDEVKPFAKSIADAMAADAPERFVATVAKSKGKGRILNDYMRNGRTEEHTSELKSLMRTS